MASRQRVRASGELQQEPSINQAPPWSAAAGPAGLATQVDTPSWGGLQQQQQLAQTEVGEFEALPDSPTGRHTAAGRSTDQQRVTHEAEEEQPLPDAARKLLATQGKAAHEKLKTAKPSTQGPSPGTAHVHLIGELTGAVGLGHGPLYCTWQLVYDTRLWSIAGGQDKGRTHASSPVLSEDGSLSGVVWESPLDILFETSSVQHWPSIVFKLFHRSIWVGRDEFIGYSLCSLPNTPGCHHISCPVWVAAEARHSLLKELTKFFTGLHPQLVDESFIMDLEQRFEQGQHLHTVACSSSSRGDDMMCGRSMVCTSANPPGAGAAGPLARQHCSSISAASSGAAAVLGSGICLRLHVLTRGLGQLSRLRSDGGADSIGHCLDRLHSSVEKMRRQHVRPKLHDLVGGDSDDDSSQAEAHESQGVQLVREGRAARLEAVHRQLFGGEGDRAKGRDQQQQQQLLQQPRGGYSAAAGATAAGQSPPRRFTASRNSIGGASPAPPDEVGAAGASPGRLRLAARISEGSSVSARAAESGRSSGGAPVLQRRPLGASSAGGASSGTGAAAGSVMGSRWAGRFASSGGVAAAGQADPGSPSRETLLPSMQERS